MRATCSDCGKKLPPDRRRRGLCYPCAFNHVYQNAVQLQNHEGPYYEKWKKSVPWVEALQQKEE